MKNGDGDDDGDGDEDGRTNARYFRKNIWVIG